MSKPSRRRAADTHSSTPDTLAVLRVVLVVVGVCGALWLVYELRTLIILLILSVLFAYVLAPLVALVQRWFPFGHAEPERTRGLAIGLAYLSVFGAVALAFSWLAPHLTDAVKQAPERMQAALNGQPFSVVSKWLHLVGVPTSTSDRVVSTATSAIEAGARRIMTAFVGLVAYLPWLVVVPIFSFFLLKEGQALTQAAMRLLPPRSRSHAPLLLQRIDTALADYIWAQLVACAIVGAIVGFAFAALHLPFAPALGVAAGIAEFVPVAGPLVIALVSAVAAALRSPMATVWVLLFLAVLRVLEDYVIYPRLVGATVHLHPLAVILAVLAGGELGGIVGVILSVPFLVIASAVYRYVCESGGYGRSEYDDENPRSHVVSPSAPQRRGD